MKFFSNLFVFSVLFTFLYFITTGCFSILSGTCIVKIGNNIVQPDKYSIVISDNAPEYERFAAQELSEYLKKLPVQSCLSSDNHNQKHRMQYSLVTHMVLHLYQRAGTYG